MPLKPELSTLDRLRELFLPTLRFMGFELYDLKLLTHAGTTTLRVAIDQSAGVSLDDCERVSKSLGALLDQADLMPSRYDLEVSSPGAERPLRSLDEYRRFLGKRANVRYRVPPGERVAEGRLTAVSEQAVELQGKDGRTISVPMDAVIAARLAVDI